MDFKPDTSEIKIPYFDDVAAAQGWEGHTTSKSIEKLVSEISTNLSLIGCIFSGCQSGSFGDRLGFQIHFAMKSDAGLAPARLDIACLPLNPKRRYHSRGRGSGDPRIDGTKKMALYMTAKAIKGMYFLSALSPDYIPFMSLMLTRGDKTLGHLWQSGGALKALMPPTGSEFKDNDGAIDATIIP